MSASKLGTGGIPTTAPNITKEYIPGQGEKETQEWPLGTHGDIDTQYEALKTTDSLAQLTYRNQSGRASLVARFARTGATVAEYGDDVQVVEELYGVDIIRDARMAYFFRDQSDNQVNFVSVCAERGFTTTQIDRFVVDQGEAVGTYSWANWTDKMKTLRMHLTRGDDYFETGFILRRSIYGARTSAINATFEGINEVAATDPSFQSDMDMLIEALPAGEWLYKPPAAEHLGRGQWRISQEWHWAVQWSVIYGGTLDAS